jgi:glycogen debranching enzyme
MELARTIAEKFCSLASKNGMAENFDARSGKGLRDRAFAWTSAAYMLLAASLSQDQP